MPNFKNGVQYWTCTFCGYKGTDYPYFKMHRAACKRKAATRKAQLKMK